MLPVRRTIHPCRFSRGSLQTRLFWRYLGSAPN
jgi:hypothetical protein